MSITSDCVVGTLIVNPLIWLIIHIDYSLHGPYWARLINVCSSMESHPPSAPPELGYLCIAVDAILRGTFFGSAISMMLRFEFRPSRGWWVVAGWRRLDGTCCGSQWDWVGWEPHLRIDACISSLAPSFVWSVGGIVAVEFLFRLTFCFYSRWLLMPLFDLVNKSWAFLTIPTKDYFVVVLTLSVGVLFVETSTSIVISERGKEVTS